MDIDIKRWVGVVSACGLGWLCGFVIYSLVIFLGSAQLTALPAKQDGHVSTPIPQRGAVSHAVVRMIMPVEKQPTPLDLQTRRKIPHKYPMVPSRSYYL